MSGIVSAFEDADGGELLWQVPGTPVEPLYHTAMSPVVDGDIVIFHVGGHDDGALTAYDTATGDVRWSWSGDGPAYGSPRVMEIEGVRQVVTYTQANVVGVAVQSGELLWRRPFTTEYDTTSADAGPLRGHPAADRPRRRHHRVPRAARRATRGRPRTSGRPARWRCT